MFGVLHPSRDWLVISSPYQPIICQWDGKLYSIQWLCVMCKSTKVIIQYSQKKTKLIDGAM